MEILIVVSFSIKDHIQFCPAIKVVAPSILKRLNVVVAPSIFESTNVIEISISD